MINQLPEQLLSKHKYSDDLLWLVLNNSDELVFLLDRQFNVALFNKQAATYVKKMGIDVIVGMSVFEFIPLSLQETFKTLYQKVLRGETAHVEDKAVRSDGQDMYFSTLLKPAFSEHGSIEGIISMTKDVTEIKKREIEIAAYQKNIDLLLNNTDESFIMLDKDFKIILFNRTAYVSVSNFFKIQIHEGFHFLDLVHPQRREMINSVLQRIMAGEEHEIELPVQKKDGSTGYISNRYRPVYDSANTIIAVVVQSKDITTEKSAEEIITNAEERWRFALESSHQGVWDWDIETGKIYYSPSLKKIYGMDEHEEGSYEFWSSHLHPAERETILKMSADVLHQQSDFSEQTYRFRVNDGFIWILDRGFIVKRDDNGKPLRVIGTTTDITAQKKAELALQESEERWRFALEGGKQGVWDWNMQTNEMFLSPSYKRMYGYQENELENRYEVWESHVHPDDLARMKATIQSHVQGSNAYQESIYRMRANDGSYKWILARGKITERDKDGNPVRMIGTHTDITETKTAEDTYKLLFFSHPNPMWIFDLDTLEIIEVNDSAVQHYGYSREEFLQLKVNDLRTRNEQEKIHSIIQQIKQSPETRKDIASHIKKNGEVIYVEVTGNKFSYKGRNTRLITVNDVTEQILGELELKKSNERFELAAKASSEALWEWDVILEEVFISKAYTDILGWQIKEDREFKEWHDYIHPDERDRVVENFYAAFNNPHLDKWEDAYRYRKADGSYAFVVDRASILRDKDGKATRLVGAIQDVTKQKQVEEELRKSNERYDYAAKATSDAVYEWNLMTNELSWGDGMTTLFGYHSKHVSINNWESLIHPIDRTRIVESLTHLIEKTRKKFWKEQYRFLHSDGTYKYVLDKGFIIRDKQDKPLRMIGAMQDITELKLKEKQLLKSNDRFVHASLATADVIWDWDLKTNEILWSDNFTKVLGWELPESKQLPSDHCFENVHPEDHKRILDSIQSFINNSSQTNWQAEYRFRKPDGSYAYISDKAYIIRSSTGNPVRIIGAMQDISERHYNERLLSLEKEIFEQSTNDAIPFNAILTQLLKGIEEIHPEAYTSILQLNDDCTIEQIAAPRIPIGFKQAIDGAKIGPHEGSCGAAMHLKQTIIVEDIDTHPLWVNFKGLAAQFDLKACWSLPIINSSGKVMGSFAVYHKTQKTPTQKEINTIERIRNIIRVLMENHWSLQEIKTANERFDAVMQATHDLIWDWDLQTNKIYRDATGLQNVYGINENGGIENIFDWLIHIHPDDHNRVEKVINDILQAKDQDTFEVEYRFKRDDGTYTYVYDRGKIIRDEEGKPLRMIGAAQDITERKKLEQILIQKELERQKAINQATVETQEQERSEIGKELHDNVNQVLTTTKLYLDLALSNSEMRTELIEKSNKNIINVINEIRQLSRSLMDPSIGDLGLVDSIHDLVGNINLTRKLHVTLDVDTTIDPLLNRNQKLTTFRIIQEALNNAIRHAKATTAIIQIDKKGGDIEMKIKDDGIGFNPETVKKGAGLKNIQNRVYLIDGTHDIESQPGQGCTLIITFPIIQNLITNNYGK